jgi:hypothetical protein
LAFSPCTRTHPPHTRQPCGIPHTLPAQQALVHHCHRADHSLLMPAAAVLPRHCRGAISDIPAAEAEYELVFKVIAYLLRKEGLVTVTGGWLRFVRMAPFPCWLRLFRCWVQWQLRCSGLQTNGECTSDPGSKACMYCVVCCKQTSPATSFAFQRAHQVVALVTHSSSSSCCAVTGAPKRQEAEDDEGFRNRLLKERRLTLSANFVPE